MRDLDHLIGNVLQLLDGQPDSALVHGSVPEADAAAFRSLEGDSARAGYVRTRIHEAVAPRGVTRVVLRGGGLRFDIVTQAPNENEPLRAGERLIG